MSPHDCIPDKPAHYSWIDRFTTNDGTEFFCFPKLGSYFGVIWANGHDVLLHVPMLENNMPAHSDDWGVDVGEVTNCDDDENFVKVINSFFGTKFTLKDFPGR